MAPLMWVSPYLPMLPSAPFLVTLCLLLQTFLRSEPHVWTVSILPALRLLCLNPLIKRSPLWTKDPRLIGVWMVLLQQYLHDLVTSTVDYGVYITAFLIYPAPTPLVKTPKLKQPPPWRYYSLGYPKSWFILSSLMLPTASVMAFQTEHSIHASARGTIAVQPCLHPMDSYCSIFNANNWASDGASASGEPFPCPPALLHLSGFGKEYEKLCQRHIESDLAAARVHHTHTDTSNLFPSLTFRQTFDPIDTAYHLTSAHQLSPNFLPSIISNRVCFRQVTDSDILPIVFDTGCSYAMTYDAQDFESPPTTGPLGTVTTASGKLDITGFGIVKWKVQASDGTINFIRVPCHLIPNATQRLFSPQDYARFHTMSSDADQFGGTANHTWITLASGKRLCANVDPASNIPVILATHHTSDVAPTCSCPVATAQCTRCSTDSTRHSLIGVFDEDNNNLTHAQRELLLDHHRLGHLGFQHLQTLYRSRTRDFPGTTSALPPALDPVDGSTDVQCCLPPRAPTCSSCPRPKCRACLLANAKRRNRPHQTRRDDPEQQGLLSTNDLSPGANVSVDQYESPVRGRLLSTRGREPERYRYSGGTIFVDHATGLVHVEHQVSLGATDTIRSKNSFEQMAMSSGVHIKRYHTDNGIFTSRDFNQELQNRGQTINFSGVGAHHQNGRAERAIQTVVWKARAMMIHQHIMWPDEYEASLWPLALSYSAFIYNHTPRQDIGLAPMELFTGARMNCHYLRRCRVWGSPAYVLDPKLQDGRKIPKWRPRARIGQFLGFSTKHSSTVGLIRNLQTGSISPQYHIVVDEKFETVASARNIDPTIQWEELFRTSTEHYIPDHNPEIDGPLPPLDNEWLDDEDYPATKAHNEIRITQLPTVNIRQQRQEPMVNQIPIPVPEVEMVAERPLVPTNPLEYVVDEDTDDDQGDDQIVQVMGTEEPDEEYIQHEEQNVPAAPNIRRSARTRNRNPRFHGDEWVNLMHWRVKPPSPDVSFLLKIDWNTPGLSDETRHFDYLSTLGADPDDGTLNEFHPLAFAAKANDVDSPSLREILNMTDDQERDNWIRAMYLELDQLQDKGTFAIVERSNAGDRQVVPSTWVFKRKWYPDGTVMKFKARFCVRGDRQWEVINGDEETHAPVVEWGTLRVVLSLMLNFGLESTQIDFRNAFVQSDLPEPIYLELPPGPFRDNPLFHGKILKVFKSLYGDRRAPRLWFQHLKNHLTSKDFGFVPSTLDHCLFLNDGIAIVVYVDDAIVISPDREKIKKVVSLLEKKGFDVKDEGNLTNYLGIKISKMDDGSLVMSQPGLTDRIIEALDLQHAAPKDTPVTEPLGKCTESPLPTGTIIYRSVVGMLMYLAGNTRPDCAFATHQCARFNHQPRLPHEVALKRIGRYLRGTRDGGIILRPSKSIKLDCYVDADFAGLWGYEEKDDPKSVKSRTGYYILLGNVPVLWTSKLQTEIALSTMEAEYIALNTAMRAFLPLKHVLNELVKSFHLPVDPESSISTVFEDNQPALALATQDPPRLTPRSKHIAVKYHWFRSHLDNNIELKYIPTHDQLADILTKPLTRIKFEEARRQIMGW